MTQLKSLKTLQKASKEASQSNVIKSISLCKKAISQSSKNSHAYKLLATNFMQLKRFQEAEKTLKQAIELVDHNEKNILMHILGCVYCSSGRYSESVELLESLFNQTGNVKVLLDIGLALANMGDYHGARDVYQMLLEIEPENDEAQFNLFSILIYFKDFNRGWVYFHTRLRRDDVKNKVQWFGPQWSGESLKNKRVLIWPEQGIGDQVFYSSCFEEATADAAHCYIICDKRLQTLYQHNFPDATVINEDDLKINDFTKFEIDFQILSGSLSYIYRSSVEAFEFQKDLNVPTKLIESHSKKLTASKLKVGISWFHGKKNENDEFSISLKELLPIFQLEKIEWVNLQYGDWQKEAIPLKENFGIEINHYQDCSAAGDFDSYGALIKNLDLVITPSTAVFMYSARLGVKTWLFTPTPHYAIGEDDNNPLWFKDVKQFCKKSNSDWTDIVKELRIELEILSRNVK